MRLLLSLLLLLPTLALADTQPEQGTRINLEASAEIELANDEVVISYRVTREGKQADKLRHEVNRITGAIHKLLEREKGLKLTTTGRNMQPLWHHPKNQPRVRSGWRFSQSEQISSMRLGEVARWLDAIEKQGAELAGLQFRISSATSKKATDALRLNAVKAFRDKAATMAKALDARSYRIITLNTSHHTPRPMMMRSDMMMAEAASAPPSLASGEGTIRVSVNGTIELPFQQFQVK